MINKIPKIEPINAYIYKYYGNNKDVESIDNDPNTMNVERDLIKQILPCIMDANSATITYGDQETGEQCLGTMQFMFNSSKKSKNYYKIVIIAGELDEEENSNNE